MEAEAVATAVSNHLESLDGAFLEALTSFADAVRREDTSTARETRALFGTDLLAVASLVGFAMLQEFACSVLVISLVQFHWPGRSL